MAKTTLEQLCLPNPKNQESVACQTSVSDTSEILLQMFCTYAKHPTRIEAENVAIEPIRKRARDIKDLKYFILKTFQIFTLPNQYSWLSAGHKAGLSTV